MCLYSATKAMIEALEALKRDRDVSELAGRGVSWAEFNDIVGLQRWRRLELEALSEEELIEMYGTSDLDEITERELRGTDEVWKKKG